jgi:hypothetical protein
LSMKMQDEMPLPPSSQPDDGAFSAASLERSQERSCMTQHNVESSF